MNRFCERFTSSILSVLACHDRVIFKGYLPFGGDEHLNRFVDYGLKIKRKDFLPFVEKHSENLVEHARQAACKADVPYQFIQGQHCKEKIVRDLLRAKPHDDGLVAVLCVMENCRSVKLLHDQGRPRLAFRRRPLRVLYCYFLDPEFGLIHVRQESGFPFTIQVYVNGHDWLARQMHARKLGFVQTDNAFTQLDDPAQAQTLADGFSELKWVAILDRWARIVNPLLKEPWLGERSYRWVVDQAEFSTDVLFDRRESLQAIFPSLLEHALLNFSAADVLGFLGRRLHPRFDGEVLTDLKTERLAGARVKHRVKGNWLKMYDKFGVVLRIETVINQPREFKVRRRRRRHGKRVMLWCPMNKGVCNLRQSHAIARASNERYLDALAQAVLPDGKVGASAQTVDRIHKPVRFQGRRRRALNVLSPAEQQLFLAVLRGDHRLRGFRTADVLAHLYPKPARSPAERRRRACAVSRKLQLLRAHGLIRRVPRSYRYLITEKGESVMNAAIYIRHKAMPNELAA
jgi:hypothetical protein